LQHGIEHLHDEALLGPWQLLNLLDLSLQLRRRSEFTLAVADAE
jgi:hypothetical protein